MKLGVLWWIVPIWFRIPFGLTHKALMVRDWPATKALLSGPLSPVDHGMTVVSFFRQEKSRYAVAAATATKTSAPPMAIM